MKRGSSSTSVGGSGPNVAQMRGIQNYFGVYNSVEMEFATLNRDKPSEKELKSDEQLKRHSVDVSLEGKPVERALHLLTIGEEVQRLSVVQNLPQLLEGNEQLCMQRVVPRVQLALPNASTEFHMAASSTFKTILEKKLVHPRTFTQTFLQSILSSIESRDPVVANAWLETLLDVIDLLPADVVKSDILPIAVNKGQISQKLPTRITACKLLGKISTRVDHQTLKKDTLPVVLSLCQDVKAEVRACICSQLPFVAQGLGAEGVKPSILPLLVELASDEESVVRLSAVEAIVCMLPHLQQDTLKNIIVPLVKKTCDTSLRNEDSVMVVLAQVFGELCLGLDAALTQTERRWLLGYYQQLAELGLRASDREFGALRKNMPDLVPTSNKADKFVECRHHCAFHFPAMAVFCIGAQDNNFEEQLYPVFCGLACDPYYEVRRTIACGLHEVTRVLGTNSGILKTELVKLLRDDSEEVLSGLIPNLSKTLILFSKSGTINPDYMDAASLEIGRALLKCESEVSVTNNWRLQELLTRQLECLHLVLPSEFIHSYMTPVLFTRIHNARQVPVRMAASNTLLVFLRYNQKSLQRNDIRSRLISELCNSPNFYSRLSFMRLCSQALELFSKKYFKEHFYLPLLERAEDRVPNIRLIFVKLLPRLKSCLRMPSDKKYFAALEASIRKIISVEKDKDVLAALDKALVSLDKIECTLDTAHLTPHSNRDEQEDQRKMEEENRLATVTGKPLPTQGMGPSTMGAGGARPATVAKQPVVNRYGQPAVSVSNAGISSTARQPSARPMPPGPGTRPTPSRTASLQRGDPSSRGSASTQGPVSYAGGSGAARQSKGTLPYTAKDSLQSLATPTNNADCVQCAEGPYDSMMAADYLRYLAREDPVLFPSILGRCFFETNRLTDELAWEADEDERRKTNSLNFGGDGSGQRKTNNLNFGGDGFGERKTNSLNFGGDGFGERKTNSLNFGGDGFDERKTNSLNFGGDGFGERKTNSLNFGGDGFGERKTNSLNFGGDGFGERKTNSLNFGGDERKTNSLNFGGDGFGERKTNSLNFGGDGFGERKTNSLNFGGDGFGERKTNSLNFGGDGFGERKTNNLNFGGDGFGERKTNSLNFGGDGFGERKTNSLNFGGDGFGERKTNNLNFGGDGFGERKTNSLNFGGDGFGERKTNNLNFGGDERKTNSLNFGGDGSGEGYPLLRGYDMGYGAKRFMVSSSVEDEFFRDAGIKIPQHFVGTSALPLRIPIPRETPFRYRREDGAGETSRFGSKLATPNKSSNRETEKTVNRRHSYLAPKAEDGDGPRKGTVTVDNGRRHSYIERLQISAQSNNASSKRFGFQGKEEANEAIALRKNAGEATALRKNAGEAIVPRKNAGEAIALRKNAGEATALRKNAGEAIVPRKNAGEAIGLRKNAGEAIVPRKEASEATALRKNVGEAIALRKNAGEATALRKNANEATVLRKNAGEATALRKNANEVIALRKNAGEATALRKNAEPKTDRRRSLHFAPAEKPPRATEKRRSLIAPASYGRHGSPELDLAVKTDRKAGPRSNNSSPGNSRSSSPGVSGRGRHLTAPNSRSGSPTGYTSSRLPVRKK